MAPPVSPPPLPPGTIQWAADPVGSMNYLKQLQQQQKAIETQMQTFMRVAMAEGGGTGFPL